MGKDEGATAVEYALLAVLIAGVVVGTVTAVGLATVGLFDQPSLFAALLPGF